MDFAINIPRTNQAKHSISLNAGECVFILGPNGSGKSTLLHYIYQNNFDLKPIWIPAHRQTWFQENVIDLNHANKVSTESNIFNYGRNHEARFQDHQGQVRLGLALSNLINEDSKHARKIREIAKNNPESVEKFLSKQPTPIEKINSLLTSANLQIEIFIDEQSHLRASKQGEPFNVSELSDGQRSVLFFASKILTAKESSIFLIDEPEAHINPSIIIPLLQNLFALRSDCKYVISTHNTDIVEVFSSYQVVLVRDCAYKGSTPSSWDFDVIGEESLPDEFKKSIIGARRNILLVEGTPSSLDLSMYAPLFPDYTVIPHKTCQEIERSVKAINGVSNTQHWLKAFGIIDSDGRSEDDIHKLRENKILAIPFFSVESIYYHPRVQKYLAETQAGTKDFETLLTKSKQCLLDFAHKNLTHLSERLAEKKVRDKIYKSIPDRSKMFQAALNINIQSHIDLNNEYEKLNSYIKSKNEEAIICGYPIRETGVLHQIAISLQFENQKDYENKVKIMLKTDSSFLELVKNILGEMINDLA